MNPTQEQLEAACKLGRQHGGWDVMGLKPLHWRPPDTFPVSRFSPLEYVKDKLICETFQKCGTIIGTARILHCNRKTIHSSLIRLGLRDDPIKNVLRMVGLWLVLALVGCTVPAEKPAPVVPLLMAALPVAAPQTNSLLVWDGQQPFTVSTGPARGDYTNSFITTNNFVLFVANIAYEISNPGGLAFWPSNRIGQLQLTGYAEGLTNPTNVATLLVFTNNPPGNMRFWGIEERTIGWE